MTRPNKKHQEEISGWVARNHSVTCFCENEPEDAGKEEFGYYWDFYGQTWQLQGHHGLKPGEIKKAKMIVRVSG